MTFIVPLDPAIAVGALFLTREGGTTYRVVAVHPLTITCVDTRGNDVRCVYFPPAVVAKAVRS